jgi:hypothetical protein
VTLDSLKVYQFTQKNGGKISYLIHFVQFGGKIYYFIQFSLKQKINFCHHVVFVLSKHYLLTRFDSTFTLKYARFDSTFTLKYACFDIFHFGYFKMTRFDSTFTFCTLLPNYHVVFVLLKHYLLTHSFSLFSCSTTCEFGSECYYYCYQPEINTCSLKVWLPGEKAKYRSLLNNLNYLSNALTHVLVYNLQLMININLRLDLLLLAGDIEENPGPGNMGNTYSTSLVIYVLAECLCCIEKKTHLMLLLC